MRETTRRRKQGAVLAETTASLVIIAMVVLTAAMMFLVAGTYSVYRIKVGFVCNNIARNAGTCTAWDGCVIPKTVQGKQWQHNKAVELANVLLDGVGLPHIDPNDLSLNDDGKTLTCRITVKGLVYPWGNTVGMPVIISDTASADLMAYQPPALYRVSPQSVVHCQWIMPCYGDLATASANMDLSKFHTFKMGVPGTIKYTRTGP